MSDFNTEAEEKAWFDGRDVGYKDGFREGVLKSAEVAKNWLPKDLGLNEKCAEQIRRLYDKARQ